MAMVDESEGADLADRGHHHCRRHHVPHVSADFLRLRDRRRRRREGLKKEIRDLEELLTKINPMAEDFVPPPPSRSPTERLMEGLGGERRMVVVRRSAEGINSRTSIAQREDHICFRNRPSEGARAALGLTGTILGLYPVKLLPSKTATAPVNPTFLPRAGSAIAALNHSGVVLGSLAIRAKCFAYETKICGVPPVIETRMGRKKTDLWWPNCHRNKDRE